MKQKNKKKGFVKFIAGALVGGALGVLFAPKKGSETRKDLSNKLKELLEKAKEIDVEEVKDAFFQKVENIETEIRNLDKEKVLKIAKQKAKELKKLSEDLLKYAKEKGTPVLEKTAKEVKEKVIEVTKEVLEKLEEK